MLQIIHFGGQMVDCQGWRRLRRLRGSQIRIETFARGASRGGALCAFPARLALSAMALAALALVPSATHAQDATWLLVPTVAGPVGGTFDFNADDNWDPDTVPTGTAFFGATDEPNISFSSIGITLIGGWTFNAGAANYDFTISSGRTVTFTGAGIVINGGSATITNNDELFFAATSTAGSATITNNDILQFSSTSTAGSATITNNAGGILRFFGSSTAGSATITNNDRLRFFGSSTAGNATITNNGGNLNFFDTSTAGSATITNNEVAGSGNLRFRDTSTAGSATITNNIGASLSFNDNSTAGSATITNNGFLDFNATSTAGNAIITNNGAALGFNNISTAGSATITNNFNLLFSNTSTAGSATITNNDRLFFFDSSTAGSATITNNNGLFFFGSSTAGNAAITTNGGGVTDFSASTGPAGNGQLTAGSLAGAGSYYLGVDQLTVGGNNLSTEVSGVISDCGPTGTECNNPGATGGSLVKTGNGVFTLSGPNTYTGPTWVNQGALIVNGAIVSPTTVNGGATLGGTGMLGPVTVNGGGVYAPGNSIGTQTVHGKFALKRGAVYEVEVNAKGKSDKVIVKGTVNLTGSTLRVLAAKGNYKPKTNYRIITNDGTDAVKGTFAKTTINRAFLTPTVDYKGGTGNDVVLTLERAVTVGGESFVSFCSVANTRNQCNVATALDRFPTNNPLFLAVLNQTASGAQQAFDALSGEIHATLPGVLADDSRYVREAILGRLMQATYTSGGNTQMAALGAGGPQVASLNASSIDAEAMALGFANRSGKAAPAYGPGIAFWTRGFGAWGDFDGNRNAATANRDLGGFVSGMDAQVSGSWRAGLATGASFSNIDVNARSSAADVDSYYLGGYTGGMAGPLALRGGGTWAWQDIDTSRAVIFPGFYERQKASYDADTGQIFGEVAYPTEMGGIALEPFGGIAYVSIDTDRFREHGGKLASLRGSADQDVGYSTVGLRAASTMQWGAMQVVPHVSGAWQHAFDDVTPGAALAFASTGIGFAITGVPLAEDSALIDAGLDFALGPNTTAGVSYSGQFGDGVTDNAVKGRLTWLF
jgi:outer membrane autotransporter protein